jgi:hypothetical protein
VVRNKTEHSIVVGTGCDKAGFDIVPFKEHRKAT